MQVAMVKDIYTTDRDLCHKSGSTLAVIASLTGLQLEGACSNSWEPRPDVKIGSARMVCARSMSDTASTGIPSPSSVLATHRRIRSLPRMRQRMVLGNECSKIGTPCQTRGKDCCQLWELAMHRFPEIQLLQYLGISCHLIVKAAMA